MDKEKLVVQVLAEESSQNGHTSSEDSAAPIDSGTDVGDSDHQNTKLLRKPLSPITKSYKDKKYPCKQCGSQFTKKLDMHIHRLAHSEAEESSDQAVDTAGNETETGLDLTLRKKEAGSPSKSDLEKPLETANTTDREDVDQQNEHDGRSTDAITSENEILDHHSYVTESDEDLAINDSSLDGDIAGMNSEDYQDMLSTILCDATHSKYRLDIIVPTPSKRTYQCGPCNKRFGDYSSYLHHRTDHPNPKLFKCSVCLKGFTIKGNLTRHQQIHKDVRLFQCHFCQKKFSQKTHLVSHLGTHTRKPFMCKLCGMIYEKEENLTIHLFHDHAESTPSSETPTNTQLSSGTKAEGLPPEGIQTTKELSKDESSVNQDGIKTYSNIGKDAEMLMEGGIDNVPNENYYRNIHYTCGTCGVVFSDFQTYIVHKKDHPTPKLFSCEQCGKGFTVKGNLQRHIQIHQDIRLHECDLCHKKFSQKTHLSAHMHVHSKERPYVCVLCGGSFTREGNLRRHVKMHSSDKRELEERADKSLQIFQCDECFKTFMRKGNLKRHQKLHTRLMTNDA